MPITDDKRTCRPREILLALGRRYTEAWKVCDEFRASKGARLPDWPHWCYLPLPGMYAVVSNGQDAELTPQQTLQVERLAALAAWRLTQGIYRFDPAVFEAVAHTPVTGDLPHEVLFRLPEWCVYVETPGLSHGAQPLHGFFAHLDATLDTGAAQLRLLLDAEDALDPLALPLGPWPLGESIARTLASTGSDAVRHATAVAGLRLVVEPLVSLLLYLCSQAAEIGDGSHRPGNPVPKKTKRGPRMFQAERPTVWDVGVRLGAALRRAYQAQQLRDPGHDSLPGLKPHVRRAHWHGFWSGPKQGLRRFDLRWLPPVAVNVESWDELPSTVRTVR
ncbi:AcrVA2 family anti-CRISPR protein [Azohydromonas australica]|uniref:AcrVA2 family anti-CRISPR protein n=1 Tax=Azohydromonas australica TaxID=364039 RepID=UPI000418D760|nr:hypothetical protein [Azohydromonas australica]